MPLYSYKHSCGMEQRFFLKENVSSKIINCFRCSRTVTAYQVRDSKLKFREADGVIGVLEQNEQKPEEGHRPNAS